MMLSLASETDPAWAESAVEHLDEILLEQAHLEKKAASAALRHMFRYAELAVIQSPLSALAREELEHFELVMEQLAARGIPYAPQHSSGYAAGLLQIVRDREPERMLDSFLCCALIEARSCERMLLLSRALVDREPQLAEMYRELVASEARHHSTYVQLAEELLPAETVQARLAEIAAHEAAVVERIAPLPRLHG